MPAEKDIRTTAAGIGLEQLQEYLRKQSEEDKKNRTIAVEGESVLIFSVLSLASIIKQIVALKEVYFKGI